MCIRDMVLLFQMLRPDMLNATCASSLLLFLFLMHYVDKCQASEVCEKLMGYIKGVVFQAVSQVYHLQEGWSLAVEGHALTLEMNNFGNVAGLQILLRQDRHMFLDIVKSQWFEMHQTGVLRAAWSEDGPLPLVDVVMFFTLCVKDRRQRRRRPLSARIMTKIKNFQLTIVKFLKDSLRQAVLVYASEMDIYSTPIPSRRMRDRPNWGFKIDCLILQVNDIQNGPTSFQLHH